MAKIGGTVNICGESTDARQLTASDGALLQVRENVIDLPQRRAEVRGEDVRLGVVGVLGEFLSSSQPFRCGMSRA
jgi:hypothetical protein